MKKLITGIEQGSIAAEMGIEAGDFLVALNGQAVVDVFDYRMAQFEEELEMLIEKADGEQWSLEIEKDAYEELGLVFEAGLMDNMRHCGNKCIFCFIDQSPPNMRPTLYVKDDDYRLSFLHGNYITLTNMTEADVERIIKHRISPVNISIHATDPELRVKMMGNARAGRSLEFLGRLAAGGIVLAMQIVLCKGYNDGAQLDKTIYDLSRFIPDDGGGCSLSVVPVGLTRYREGLTPLESLEKEDCRRVVEQVTSWQEKFLAEKDCRFVFAADEFYLKAELDLPDYDDYEDFPQIDNGVGMITAFREEFHGEIPRQARNDKVVTLVTGLAAAPFLRELLADFPAVQVSEVVNEFYGPRITVAGLLTGRDIISQLKGQDLGQRLLLPKTCLRDGEDVFLDDVSLQDVSDALGVPVVVIETAGDALLEAIVCD